MRHNILTHSLLLGAAVVALFTGTRAEATMLDTLTFGSEKSEQDHALTADRSDTITGGLRQPARRLLPPATADLARSWQGGSVAFILKVDPDRPTYLTVRLWGSDATENRLILYCEGKQVGYRHLGDIDNLDIGQGGVTFNNRFYYNTTPLPLELTQGKQELHCEIRGTGRIFPYGTDFAQYQRVMIEPTRGIYRVYTHTDPFFTPPVNEKQGTAPTNPPVRQEPGPEVMDAVRARLSHEIVNLLASPRPLNQMQTLLLARAYHVKWCPAYHNPQVITQALASIDALFIAYRKDPKLAEADPATPNPDWFGLGPSGWTVALLADPVRPHLSETIADGAGGKATRAAALSEMLIACRDWHRRHRRLYSNQSMINDMYGIYLANRGVEVVDPQKAMPEPSVLRYLYESVGLEPWRDSDPDPQSGERQNWGIAPGYMELTRKGLTRELGYVGSYGEVIDWVTHLYEATRPSIEALGDAKILVQLIKIAHARAVFRAPALDADGFRAMRLETVVGWRDLHYPGDVTYAQGSTWDGSPLEAAAITLDPRLIGYAQQMLADNQYFASVRDRLKDTGLRVTSGLLGVPDQYEVLKAQPDSPHRLPMSPGQPDFTFTDVEDGVLAVKHGQHVLYASLYWRAYYGVNNLGRVHYTSPTIDRNAVVRLTTQFEPSGMVYARRDWTNFGFGGGGTRYPDETLHSAHAGEKLLVAKLPDGVKFKPGDESIYAGRAEFYTLRYGPYLIGMNTTASKTFKLPSPSGVAVAPDLVSGKSIPLPTGGVSVGPMSTVILYLGAGSAP